MTTRRGANTGSNGPVKTVDRLGVLAEQKTRTHWAMV
jgi:hypothetical protein